MLKDSITMHVLMWLKNILLSYKESFFYNLILRFVSRLGEIFRCSMLRNLIVSETRYEKSYPSSVTYSVANRIIGLLLGIFRNIYNLILRASQDGVLRRIYSKVHNTGFFKFEYIYAAFFFVMMIVPHDYWNNIYAVGMAGVFCVMYLVSYLSGRKFAVNACGLTLSLVAFVLAIVVAVFITPVFFDGVRIALFFISSIVFMLVIWGSISDIKTLKTVVSFLICGLFVMCMYAIYQNYVGVPVDLSLTDVKANEGMPGRVYSTFGNPNNFAETIVMILPFVYAMFICTKSKRTKTLLVLAFAVCMTALAMSYSRSCYVAFAIATVVFILIYDWRLLLPAGIIAIMCIPLLPETVMNRIFTIGSMQDSSNAYRPLIWEGVIRLIKDRGPAGIGIGPLAFADIYPSYANPIAISAPHSHMLYMEILVELGILGVFGFFGFMYTTFKKGLSVVNQTDKTLRCMIIAGISGFAGISFTSCAEYIWFYPRVMFVFWIVAGLILAAARISKQKNTLINK